MDLESFRIAHQGIPVLVLMCYITLAHNSANVIDLTQEALR